MSLLFSPSLPFSPHLFPLGRAAIIAATIALVATSCGGSEAAITDQIVDGGGNPPTETASTQTPEAGGAAPVADATETPDVTAAQTEPTAGDETAAAETPAGASAGCGAPLEPGFQDLTVTSGGTDRVVRLYVPIDYDPTVAVPVVLNWHGLGSTGDEQLLYSEFTPIANRETFLVAAPTGLPNPGDSLARASWELSADQDPNRDDVAFANDVLDAVEAAACVDTNRVYSTGMSNGGYFTSVLVCEMADRLAAAASVAGVIHDESCTPSRPVSYMEIHGTADTTVPMLGGTTSLEVDADQQDQIAALMANVIPDEVAEFASDFHCAEPTTTAVNDRVTETVYDGCDDGVEVRFYAVDGAGHVWPGSGLNAMFETDTTASDSLEASEEVWAFFAAHTRN